jgi:outer membrane protein assembly factor BamB
MSVRQFLLLISLPLLPLAAQHWVNPDFPTHRLDLRDLGYPEINQIPANSSAITSLSTGASGRIYGGTSGDEAYLFFYDPAINKVRHLGKFSGEEGIHHSLVVDRDGFIYAGTGKNIFREVEFSKKVKPGSGGAAATLWEDVKRPYNAYAGGHLYRYDPRAEGRQVLFPTDRCPAEDLGVPVPHDGIYALAIDQAANIIYGISYPNGRLFAYKIADKQFNDLGEIDSEIFYHGPEREWRSLPRALMADRGRVYTSGKDGYLVYLDMFKPGLHSTGQRIPGEYYPVQAYTGHPVVEAFTKAADGIIYGASSDGFLFSFNPEDGKLLNLGKPRVSRRVRALTISGGRVYIIAGERTEPCRLFSYDPGGAGFQDLGMLAVDRSPYYSWRGQQFDSMASGADGTVYIGESERRSHLFLYLPEPGR